MYRPLSSLVCLFLVVLTKRYDMLAKLLVGGRQPREFFVTDEKKREDVKMTL